MATKYPSPIDRLLDRWRTLARIAGEDLHDERTARLFRTAVQELEEALQAVLDELLDAHEAEDFSGHGADNLRRTMVNHGRPYAPRYRIADLPLKPRKGQGSPLPRILLLAAEAEAGPEDHRREQIRRQARETARQRRLAG